MKARSLILSVAILIAFTFATISFAQTKPQDKSKTTNKTEKVVQNKTTQKKSLSHAAVWNTKKNESMKTAKTNNQKMAMTNDKMKEERIKVMKNKTNNKNHLKNKTSKDKKEKSNDKNNSNVK